MDHIPVHKIIFAGPGIKSQKHIVDAFNKAFPPDPTKNKQTLAHVLHIDREGIVAKGVGDILNGYNNLSIGITACPFGINAWNGQTFWESFRLSIGSLSPEKMIKVSSWNPGRYVSIANKYGLPIPDKWNIKEHGSTVLLLPKIKGWKHRTDYVNHYMTLANDIVKITGNLIIRVHPRNVQRNDATALLNSLKKIKGVAIDTHKSQTSFDTVKIVLCDWSTAVVRYVMHGIPVINVSDKPETMIANPVSFGSLDDLCNKNLKTPNITPIQFLDDLAQTVFSDEEAKNGSLTNFLRSYSSGEIKSSTYK